MHTATPQEIIAFSVQLHTTICRYFELEAWTPVMGAMLLSGIHPSAGCVEISSGGVGLDNEPLNAGSKRFGEARSILNEWTDWCEDQAITLTEIKPIEFVDWFVEDGLMERYAVHCKFSWAPAFKELAGYPPEPNCVPFAISLYAAKTAEAVETVLDKLGQLDLAKLIEYKHPHSTNSLGNKSDRPIMSPTSSLFATAKPDASVGGGRRHLTTDDFAAALSLKAQSIRKRYSETGSYHGVRPTKLPSRRLAWPADSIEQLLKGGALTDE